MSGAAYSRPADSLSVPLSIPAGSIKYAAGRGEGRFVPLVFERVQRGKVDKAWGKSTNQKLHEPFVHG